MIIFSNFNLSFEERIIVYRLIRMIAVISSLLLFIWLEKQKNHKQFNDSLKLYFKIAFIASLGAKASSMLEFYISNNFTFENFHFNIGFRISGIALFVFLFLTYKKELNIKTKTHLFIVSILALFVIGKWSCFFLGDTCYGLKTNSYFGFQFYGQYPSHGLVHPVTIYTSFFYFVLLIIISSLLKKFNYNPTILTFGFIITLIYSFTIEFIRINTKLFFNLSMNQIIYAITLFLLIFRLLMKNNILSKFKTL